MSTHSERPSEPPQPDVRELPQTDGAGEQPRPDDRESPPADGPGERRRGVRLERRTKDLIVDARAALADEGLEAEAAAAMDRLKGAIGRSRSIVVVGEVGRGKSTLVNALLGTPDASPVGIGETTGAYVRFEPPTDDLPLGEARLEYADGTSEAADRATVRDWVTVDGAAIRSASDETEPPIGAVVAAESGHLPGVAIVDTPGTGGLDADHAKLALSRAATASVLVLVTDAGGRISRPELEFLSQCAEHVGGIVIAMSMIDKNPRAWRRILDENRAVVDEWDARFAQVPIVPVSGFRACEAEHLAAGDERDRAVSASRIDELVSPLAALLAAGDRLPVTNVVTQLRAAVTTAIADVRSLGDADRGDHSPADLDAQRDRLKALGAVQQRWRLEFDRDFGDLRSEVVAEAQRRASALSAEWDHALAERRWGISGRAAQSMRVDICAQVAGIEADLRIVIRDRILELARTMFERAGLEADLGLDGVAVLEAKGGERSVEARDGRADFDLGLIMQTVVGGGLGANLAGGAAASATAILGLATVGGAVVGGGVMLGLGLALRGMQKHKSNMRTYLQQTAGNLRSDLTEAYSAHLRAVRPELMFAFERAMNREANQLRAELKAAAAQESASAQEREATQRGLSERLERLERLRDRLATEVDRLQADVAATATEAADTEAAGTEAARQR